MATKIVMEALSPTMEEGRLVEWKKREGDPVAVGDVLAEVETDKAVMELVARAGGTLLKQLVAAGATVPVSSPVGWIGQAGESVDGGGAATSPVTGDRLPVTAQPQGPSPQSAPSEAARPSPAPPETSERPTVQTSDRIKASPLARKIAGERGVDLAAVSGSGPEGRVVKRDLEAVSGERLAVSGKPGAIPLTAHRLPLTAYEDIPLSQLRKTIAKRLAQSIGPIPTFYLTSEVDMERVAEARDALNAAAGEQDKISFNDIVLKAVATALRQHPACNAWWQDDHVRVWQEVHLGMAVAVEDGLITPVIRHADAKSLRELSRETRDLAKRARDRKLTAEEYTGSTFSVSNLGMFDIEHFTAIINPPEAGILAVGSIAAVPAVVAGQLQVRRRMRMTLSCDHRVIDGATGARFLQTLKLLLENPLALVW
ncbi:MAG TPA: dihydrolipoamide acetyltransferase family protein [Gemmatimonadales bacterium]|jgi:pyruvate dehydrogenase E2 component (dihydrolipoamide acetyltransferase)|nr:dihydrolipoamide acetyltransferase family protein [Gemmatimonadales bacterium]